MQEVKNHTALDRHIIRTLVYFDIFKYPLKSCEVFRFLGADNIDESTVTTALNNMVSQQCLSKSGQFYSLYADQSIIRRRIAGNATARKMLPLARRKAMIISKFPFVRAVMASGSLSKDYMDENSDFDFFIVTAPSRLWICRTLLVLYKRIFLLNDHRHFCVNYFVDADHLEIEEKNLFTATELATVIPLYGREYYKAMQCKNSFWVLQYFPNIQFRDLRDVPACRMGILKKSFEKFIDILFGNRLEKFLMRMTLLRWKKLYAQDYDAKSFNVAFKTKKYVSKNHPRNYQKKVMEAYQEKLRMFEKQSDHA